MNFKRLALAYACICFIIASFWLFAPQIFVVLWGTQANSMQGTATMMGRRAAALFIGVGVILVYARNAAPSEVRSAIVYGLATACFVLAALGVFEFFKGTTHAGILVAALGEVLMAAAILAVNRAELANATRHPPPNHKQP